MGLNIISGKACGMKLESPKQARPSSARLREGLIAMLTHNQEITGHYPIIMDLFAGSGAVGLEMLSNFAAKVIFVENDSKNLPALKKNCEKFSKHQMSIEIIAKDAYQLKRLPAMPDLIFADPPYQHPIDLLFRMLEQSGLFSPQTAQTASAASAKLLIIQTAPSTIIPPSMPALMVRRYGNAMLHFFKR